MVAADDNRGFNDPFGHQFIEDPSSLGAFTVTQPANAGRKPLEMDFLARQIQPAAQVLVVGEQRFDRFIGAVNIFGIA